MSHANASSDLLSAIDAVAVISNLIPARPVGALYLQNEDGTRSGKFFFKDGLIYAVKVDGYEFPLAYRAAHSGLIDEDDQRSVLASASGDPSNPLLVSLYLQRHLLDKKTVESYLKENFLAASGFLLSLNPVRAEWRDGESTEDFAVRYIDVPTLVSICQKRASTLQTAAERMGTTVEGLFASPIKMLREVVDEDSLNVESIWTLHKADGVTSLDDAAAALGFTRLYLAKLVYRMWGSGIIEVLAPTQTVEGAQPQVVQTQEEADLTGDSVPLYVAEEDAETVTDQFAASEEPEDSEEYALPISLAEDSDSEEPAHQSVFNASVENEPVADSLDLADPFEAQEVVYEEPVAVETFNVSEEEVETEEDVNNAVKVEPEATGSNAFFVESQFVEESADSVVQAEPVAVEEILVQATSPTESVSVVPGDDADEDFNRLTQAITNLTERARLANVHVETAARAVEDAGAAVRESEEEAADIAQVLERLRNEVTAQEERLAVAEAKVVEQRRQEEQKRVEAQQAQSQAALLAERLEKLRSAF